MLEVGRYRVHLVSDGRFAMDGGAMFGIVPKPLWERHVPTDEKNRIDMSLHCPLAEDGKDAVLIDTGLGERLSEKESALYRVDRQGGLRARLGGLGIDPEEVTHVVLTHLHFDHLGGAVLRNGAGHLVPAFPRAKHFIQRAELETALHPTNESFAAAYWELGRYDEALEAAQRLVATQPTYLTGYAYIAMNAVALGRLEEARTAITEGRRVQPDLSLELMQNYFGVSRPKIDARRNAALREAGLE